MSLCFRCCIFAFAIVLGIGGIIYTNIEINKIKRDIENKNFIIYTGTFEYRYRGVHSSYDIAVVDFLDANRKVTDTVHFLDHYNIYSTYEKAKADILKAKMSLSKLTPNQQKALAEELFGVAYVETVLKALFNNNLMR